MSKGTIGQKKRSLIELSCDEAQAFLLKQESYCTIDLPQYFQFSDLLNGIVKVLEGKQLSDLCCKSPRKFDGVNHLILNNKDGRYAWRPLELIHPALYVSLVNKMTDNSHWESIRRRFSDFDDNPKIKCLSLPVESLTDEKDKSEQIGQWWQDVEQKSIELSLSYESVIRTDITDCYAAIYTHSIAWALHTKPIAKEKRGDKNLIGNIIDNHVQDMRHGQTNGIPQGSVLMDLIGEMVLGYADTELTKKIDGQGIEDYHVLRYRDDYRIFVNNPQDGERILKCLTEVMIDLGLKLNPSKTDISNEVIRSSIKDDKISWMFRRQSDQNLQKRLLIIHDHSMKYPNSGSLDIALNRYYKRILKTNEYDCPLPLISIVTDIAYRNPRTYAIASAILSKLISLLNTECEKLDVIEKIQRKFSQLPNTGQMDIWLQRISHSIAPDTVFDEPLCKLVRQEKAQIWCNSWICSKDLLEAIDAHGIVAWTKLDDMPPIVSEEEVSLFRSYY